MAQDSTGSGLADEDWDAWLVLVEEADQEVLAAKRAEQAVKEMAMQARYEQGPWEQVAAALDLSRLQSAYGRVKAGHACLSLVGKGKELENVYLDASGLHLGGSGRERTEVSAVLEVHGSVTTFQGLVSVRELAEWVRECRGGSEAASGPPTVRTVGRRKSRRELV